MEVHDVTFAYLLASHFLLHSTITYSCTYRSTVCIQLCHFLFAFADKEGNKDTSESFWRSKYC
jgi:hypothetical protein